MNEDRLITLILLVVFILGAAGLAGNYYVRSSHRPVGAPLATESQTGVTVPKTPEYIQPSDRVTIPKETVPKLEEKTKGEPLPSIETPVSPSPKYTGAIVMEGPKGEPPTPALSQPGTQVTIQETSKANGSFERAQDITEGVIVGSRGSKGDRTDLYKIRAPGRTMVIELEPSLTGGTHYFKADVYNSEKRKLGETIGNTRSTTTIPVTPQETYYIKVNLNHAPLHTPTYKVHVRFHEREIS
jgi:hypothetical protein